ncbi:MAG: acyltransferase [Lachnospiraceae bacterium]|nr:acyltransferase [Lachnospiraceae bacterium]
MNKADSRQEYTISPETSEILTILKAIFTIMVLFGHSYGNQINFADKEVVVTGADWLRSFKVIVSSIIVSASVPGFYFLSSFFLYRKPYSYKENLIKKTRSIAVPYLIITTFWIAVLYIARNIPPLAVFFSSSNQVVTGWGPKDWITAYVGSNDTHFPFVYPLWFLRDLFIMNLLSKLFDIVTDLLGDFSVILFLLPWLFVASSPIFFCDIRAVCFWGIGCYFAKRPGSLSFLNNLNKGLLTIAYIVLNAAAYIVSEAGFSWALPLYRISVFVSLMFWYMVASLKGSYFKTFMLFTAKYCFCIYLFHEFSMTTLKKILAKILPSSVAFQFIQFIIVPVIILFFTIACSMLLEKFTPGLYAVLNGRSRKKKIA